MRFYAGSGIKSSLPLEIHVDLWYDNNAYEFVGKAFSIMKKKLLEEYDISKTCAFCEYATKTLDSEKMLCRKRGLVNACFSCRAFSYDLMKRMPKRMPPLLKP